MIGILQSYSDVYLYIMGAAMLAAFGIPLIFVPMRWAASLPLGSAAVRKPGCLFGAFIRRFHRLDGYFCLQSSQSTAGKTLLLRPDALAARSDDDPACLWGAEKDPTDDGNIRNHFMGRACSF